ncbi:MAG: hypothetical protein ACRD8K_01890, partial [Nitrososphaeraceae archaeon]
MVNWKITFIIFGIPMSLLLLTISIFSMVNLTNVSDAINSTIIPERVQNVIHYSFDIGIFLGLIFGFLSIAFAIWFGYGGKL